MSRSAVHPQEFSFVLDRNRFLLEELKEKAQKISNLDKKCEVLEMKLVATNVNHSLDSKRYQSPSKFDIPKASTPSNSKRIQELQSIRQRLDRVNFDKVLTDLRRYKPSYGRG